MCTVYTGTNYRETYKSEARASPPGLSIRITTALYLLDSGKSPSIKTMQRMGMAQLDIKQKQLEAKVVHYNKNKWHEISAIHKAQLRPNHYVIAFFRIFINHSQEGDI